MSLGGFYELNVNTPANNNYHDCNKSWFSVLFFFARCSKQPPRHGVWIELISNIWGHGGGWYWQCGYRRWWLWGLGGRFCVNGCTDYRASTFSTVSSLSTASKDSMFSTLSVASSEYSPLSTLSSSSQASGTDSDFCEDAEEDCLSTASVPKSKPAHDFPSASHDSSNLTATLCVELKAWAALRLKN